MAFAVVCKSCQARFLLNDDLLRRKVAGRVVTVRCRQCHATIEVDASDVDPKAVSEAEKPAPPKPAPKMLKPTPAPPRPPAKSTLMGIGSPARPAGATELTALSPGFLNMGTPPPVAVGQRGFPEPPPPPSVIEELTSGDWEITETPPLVKTDATPESVDDFAEELPPSSPPVDEEMPSSTGTPSLKSLAHHDDEPPKPQRDDFLANMSAAMNGGIMSGDAGGAPTIDVSAFTVAPSENAPSKDVSVPDARAGKQTLPLFALASDDVPAEPAPVRRVPGAPRPPGAQGDGSLSPSAREAEARDSVRERKNVVAPATESVRPAAPGQRRSGLAAPVLLALAVAAGLLIWKRNALHPSEPAQAEPPAPAAPAEGPRALVAGEPVAPEPTLAASAAAPAAADDLTFETTPTKPAPVAATAHEKPSSATTSNAKDPVGEKPAVAPAETKPEPEKPVAKDEPQAPTTPAEPAGPFDRAAATAALSSSAAQASACRKEGDPSGVASVIITFAPSGRVTSANISGPPFAGTPTGGCIAAALRKTRVPAFDGDRVTVSKTIVIQ